MSEEQPAEAAPPPILSMTSPEVRTRLVEVLELDLIGPSNDHAFAHELLKQSPRRWYLTGYLVPKDAPKADKQSGDETDEEDISQPFVNEAPRVEDPKVEPPNQKAPGGADDDNSEASETPSRLSFLPSSMGLSVLLPKGNDEVEVTVRWGDYLGEVVGEGEEQIDEKEVNRAYEEDIAKDIARTEIEEGARVKEEPEAEYKTRRGFRRDPREEVLQIQLTDKPETIPLDVPNSRGLKIHASWRPLSAIPGSVVGEGTRLLSVFIVNERRSEPITYRDFAFQVEVELTNKTGFLGRPDLRGLALEDESDQDDRIADLHYRDVLEYTVGHGVSTTADEDGVSCRSVRTCWIPSGEVPRTDHAGKKSIGKTEINPLFPALRSGPTTAPGASPKSKFLAAMGTHIRLRSNVRGIHFGRRGFTFLSIRRQDSHCSLTKFLVTQGFPRRWSPPVRIFWKTQSRRWRSSRSYARRGRGSPLLQVKVSHSG